MTAPSFAGLVASEFGEFIRTSAATTLLPPAAYDAVIADVSADFKERPRLHIALRIRHGDEHVWHFCSFRPRGPEIQGLCRVLGIVNAADARRLLLGAQIRVVMTVMRDKDRLVTAWNEILSFRPSESKVTIPVRDVYTRSGNKGKSRPKRPKLLPASVHDALVANAVDSVMAELNGAIRHQHLALSPPLHELLRAIRPAVLAHVEAFTRNKIHSVFKARGAILAEAAKALTPNPWHGHLALILNAKPGIEAALRRLVREALS